MNKHERHQKKNNPLFGTDLEALVRSRAKARLLPCECDTFLVERIDLVFDRAYGESILAEREGRSEDAAYWTRATDQAVHLAMRAQTHLMGTLDFRFADEDCPEPGTPMTPRAIEMCYETQGGEAEDEAWIAHMARWEVYQSELDELDEAELWQETRMPRPAITDEMLLALAASDELWERNQ